KRKNCLTALKKIGYQVGTGVMIGLPMQTIDDLVDDLFFFKEMDVDMIGMGPYLASNNTPLNEQFPDHFADKDELLQLSLKMIAAARLLLKDVNIASTTALQALKYDGREQALKCGANIVMPNITLRKYRPYYQLYDNKPCVEENSELCKMCLTNRIISVGEKIGYDEWGDSIHFQKTKYRNTF
ncbi:MAG: [FeFe] hydrogenase H-cluster radical SAM maturase HydE, partial [Bacteroidota bacterium]